MTIGVIGLGLIGGSMAIDLRRRGFAQTVVGVDNDELHAVTAVKIGLIDRAVTLDECIAECDVIIVAIPADTAEQVLRTVLNSVSEHQVVLDVCSTKGKLCSELSSHTNRRRYVATHPMAGTEYSGPWAAKEGLFDGNAAIICNADQSADDALTTAKLLYDTLNMRVIYMDAASHDMHVAYVSHISHISSFALALTVLDKERDETHIFDLASGGFASTVRLAKSNAQMWCPIFVQNSDNIVTVLDNYIDKLQAFRTAIATGNHAETEHLIEKSNKIKRILK